MVLLRQKQGERLWIGGEEFELLKIESLREVKKALEVGGLSYWQQNRPALAMFGDDRGTCILLVLAANPRFWERFDRAARSKSWTDLEKL